MRIGPASTALLGKIIVGTVLVVSWPSAAQARCETFWDVSGTWAAMQTNGAAPNFVLLLWDTTDHLTTAAALQGTAEYHNGPFLIHGSVDGSISGDHFVITAYGITEARASIRAP
jgi:hypothetical protein